VDSGTVAWLKSGMREGSVSPDVHARLLQRGFLTTRSEAEEQTVVRTALTRHIDHVARESTFTVILSYDCNFRCTYCSQRVVQLKGSKYLKEGMSDEVMDAAFSFMDEYGPKSSITLFGGEPFAPGNEHRVERFLEWVRRRGTPSTAVSNGYDWDTFKDLIKPDVIRQVQITVDGPPEVHNRRRIALGTKDSFWTIISNIRWALDSGIAITLRINCDRTNVEKLEQLTRILIEEGLHGHDRFAAYLAPVQGNGVMKNHEPLFNYGEMYGKLLDAPDAGGCQSCGNHSAGAGAGETPFNTDFLPSMRHELRDCLEGKQPGLSYNYVYCGAYTNLFTLDPHGRLYACWDYVDDPKHAVGAFHPQVEFRDEQLAVWRKRGEEVLMKQCLACPYVLLHGSGCQAEALRQTGNYWERDCQDYSVQFDLAMKAAMGALKVGGRRILPLTLVS